MQLGIDRNRGGAYPPDAIKTLEILRAIRGKDRDAIAGHNFVGTRQRGGDGCGAAREGLVVRVKIEAGQKRRRLGAKLGGCGEPFGDVHR